ncbi:MAG: transcription antitermination protein NusB [Candidatus Westeberhardia cardiocondylae]|nr:transcription antitermination protein NusB [Candidatus Westeberhardia cardiocondylae]
MLKRNIVKKIKPVFRRYTRICVIQLLYAWQISHNKITKVDIEFLMLLNKRKIDIMYFNELYCGAIICLEKLDQIISSYVHRSYKSIGYVERSILCLAVFELLYQKNVPYRVIINEAIELSKMFGSQRSYKFTNKVLDKIGEKIRPNKQ